MKRGLLFLSLILVATPAFAQRPKDDEEFAKQKPTIGDVLADVTVYDADGKELKTSSLRGHHSVLVFGCLT